MGEDALGSMIREELNKLLLHKSPLLLIIIHLILVFDLVLDDLLNYVLQGDNADNTVEGVSTFPVDDLRHDANVSETFLEISQERFKLIISRNVHSVSQKNTRKLFQINIDLFWIDKKQVPNHQNTDDVVFVVFIYWDATISPFVYLFH